MTPLLLQTVVRAADACTTDSDLLGRFVQKKDEAAFEEIVRRHGPLVWSVCRQMLPHQADAEDAFQAVFLVLIQGAGKIRTGEALPSWLHGVAVRVAEKTKRTFSRRRKREARAAVVEADRSVSDAAWSALMAAVHEEVQRLPDPERTAFVLCELEGVRQSDAAARLGWPRGTLSGRLCKARQLLIDRLTHRGIVPGVLALGGLAGSTGEVPAALVAKVSSFSFALADGVSSTAAALAHGLVGGATMRTKFIVAALLVAGAVGLTGGSMILSHVDAQVFDPNGGQPIPVDPNSGLTPAGSNTTPGTSAAAVQPAPVDPNIGLTPAGSYTASGTSAAAGADTIPYKSSWEYKFIDLKNDDRDTFEKEIKQAGTQGWEFCASERLRNSENLKKGGENTLKIVLVFKKSHGADFQPSTGPQPGTMGGMRPGPMAGPGMSQPGPMAGPGMSQPGTPAVPTGSVSPPAPVGNPNKPAAMPPVGSGFSNSSGLLGSSSTTSSTASITLFKLKHADALEMAQVLKQVFQTMDITPDPRTNQLIVRGTAEQKDECLKLMKELDVEGANPRQQPLTR